MKLKKINTGSGKCEEAGGIQEPGLLRDGDMLHRHAARREPGQLYGRDGFSLLMANDQEVLLIRADLPIRSATQGPRSSRCIPVLPFYADLALEAHVNILRKRLRHSTASVVIRSDDI